MRLSLSSLLRRASRRGRPLSAPRGAAAGLVLGAVLAALAACSPRQAPPETAPRPVRAVTVRAEAVDLVGAFAAEVKPRVESALGFQVGGRLVERRVQAGQRVARGTILARLDEADLRLGRDAAQAQVAAAEVDSRQAQADLARYARLRDEGFISAAEFEARRSAAEAADARAAQARAQRDVQRNQTGYADLRAPADGVVTAVEAEAGQVVAAGQTVLRLAATGDKEAAFQIPEGRVEAVRHLRQGQFEGWSDQEPVRGEIREIAASADPVTRTFAARLRLIDPPPGLALGMSGTVRFVEARADALFRVPLSALLRAEDRTWVWVLRGDGDDLRAARQAVRIATVGDAEAWVAEGLSDGMVVVTAGVHQLRDGQEVRRLEGGTPPAARDTPTGAASLVTGKRAD